MPQHGITDLTLATDVVRQARRIREPRLVLRSLKTAHTVARATQDVRQDLSAELCSVADAEADGEWQGTARLAAFIDAVVLMDRAAAETHLEHLHRAAHQTSSPRLRWNAELAAATWSMLNGDVESSDRWAGHAAELGRRYGMSDTELAAVIHAFFGAYHTRAHGALATMATQLAADHPELSAFTAGAGLALAAAGDVQAAGTMRDRLFPRIVAPGVDETWPLAACLTAELCFKTDAGREQREPLRAALNSYPGRLAVLGAAVAECGPVQRYIGLLTAADDANRAIALLRSAAADCEAFGAPMWSRHIAGDLAQVSGVVPSPAPRG